MRCLPISGAGTALCLMATCMVSFPSASAFAETNGISRLITVTPMKSSAQEDSSKTNGPNTAPTVGVLEAERQEASGAIKAQQQQLAGEQQGTDMMLGELQAPLGDLSKPTDRDIEEKTTHSLLPDMGSMSNPLITETSEIDKGAFNGAVSALEGQDKTDNFTIQDLISTVNQNEQLASSILKKSDQAKSDAIGKIGDGGSPPPATGIDLGQSAQRVVLPDEEPPSETAQKVVSEDDAAPADEPQDTVEPQGFEEMPQVPDAPQDVEMFQDSGMFPEPDPVADM